MDHLQCNATLTCGTVHGTFTDIGDTIAGTDEILCDWTMHLALALVILANCAMTALNAITVICLINDMEHHVKQCKVTNQLLD